MSLQIIKPGTTIDFLGRWRICAAFSVVLILLGLVGVGVRGFRTGIDFAGGNEVQVRFGPDQVVEEGAIREVVQGLGISGASVVRYGTRDTNEFLIKFKVAGKETPPVGAGEPEEGAEAAAEDETGAAVELEEPAPELIAQSLLDQEAQLRGPVDALVLALEDRIGPVTLERVEFVGPKVGAELRRAGLLSLGLACLLILGYIAFRFSARFAPGAVVAIVHDVLITAGIWVLLGREFDLRVLAALLAIIGYSLNDTIIVYDRIRENMEIRTKRNLRDVLNLSVNQTLSRTLLTSITTLLAVLSLLLIGGEVIRPFALAMAIGIVVGTYSSVYVAAPTLLFLETRFGEPVKS